MDHIGIGPVQVSNFLTTINLPPVNPKTLRRRENEIGKTLKEFSQDSCDKALINEANLTE